MFSKKEYYAKNRDRIRLQENKRQKEWLDANPDIRRRRRLESSMRELSKLERLAGSPRPSQCEICACRDKIGFNRSSSGNFRGWLCNRCSMILGLTNNDPAVLLALKEYLLCHERVNEQDQKRSA